MNSSNKIKLDLLAVWVHDVGSELVSFDHLCLNSLTTQSYLTLDLQSGFKTISIENRSIENCCHHSQIQGALPILVCCPKLQLSLRPLQVPSLTDTVVEKRSRCRRPGSSGSFAGTGGARAVALESRLAQFLWCSCPPQCCHNFALLRPSNHFAQWPHQTGHFFPCVPFSPLSRP